MAFSIESQLPSNPASARSTQKSGRFLKIAQYSAQEEEGVGEKNRPENSIFIPNLNIPENGWPSSPNDKTFDAKMENDLRSEAFNEWLFAKLEAERYTKQQQLEQIEKQKEECEIRRQNSKRKLKEWFQKKREAEIRVKMQQKEKNEMQPQMMNNNVEKDKEKCFNAWLMKKIEKEKSTLKKISKTAKQEEMNEQRRKVKARIEYEKWLRSASSKPKPVPLNQGPLSLRGTISPIYINPIPWVSCDENLTRST